MSDLKQPDTHLQATDRKRKDTSYRDNNYDRGSESMHTRSGKTTPSSAETICASSVGSSNVAGLFRAILNTV
jgi:hypothetical protein